MDLHKVYYDQAGCSGNILQIIKREPEWAANRLQEGERAIEQLAALKNKEPNAASTNSAMDAITAYINEFETIENPERDSYRKMNAIMAEFSMKYYTIFMRLLRQ